jgi:hypothetical protein
VNSGLETNLDGRGRGLIEKLSQHLSEEKHEIPQRRVCVLPEIRIEDPLNANIEVTATLVCLMLSQSIVFLTINM